MKVYMVEACWYDDAYDRYEHGNIAAFTSVESAQRYIDVFPEVNEAASRRLDELLDKRGYRDGQAIDPDDKELMDAWDEHVCFGDVLYDKMSFWISEYKLR